ncbi:hypothetical protein MtrunA17_Chr1g0206971 [Medicago truncatula]|uniref:Uncharacterized protein n=1 Tax=Medicago truncatula TaxID=3880 RepID=A0A072VRF6_MEDTR|nr:hypothetical protein MTR_1g106060 [Medicago truncatula]RHN82172.1 hypothetical protein MtrunA17_Chr1g0206971 [Medicago truncatula]
MTKKTAKESKLKHFILGPVRILKKARQFYMKSVIECAGGYGVGAANHIPYLPKPNNINTNGGNHIASRQKQSNLGYKSNTEVKKMGKIDEDQPCHFESNQIGFKTNLLHLIPSRRSSAAKNPNVRIYNIINED